MALYTVTTSNTIIAQDLNQIIGVLQKASGATEAGAYILSQMSYVSSGFVSQWFASLSRGVTPVSVSFDTSLVSPSNLNSPSSAKLNANGFQINSTTTGATNDGTAGGLWTIQY